MSQENVEVVRHVSTRSGATTRGVGADLRTMRTRRVDGRPPTEGVERSASTATGVGDAWDELGADPRSHDVGDRGGRGRPRRHGEGQRRRAST